MGYYEKPRIFESGIIVQRPACWSRSHGMNGWQHLTGTCPVTGAMSAPPTHITTMLRCYMASG